MMHVPIAAAGVLCAVLVLWAISRALHDVSIVDIAWGPLLALVALLGLPFAEGWQHRRLLVALLVSVWALRLALHVTAKQRGHGEDPRYAAWREQYGERWELRSLFTVFLLQGFLLLIVALPIFFAQASPAPAMFTPFDVAGVLMWLAGLLLETVADAQLLRWRRTRAPGRLLTDGLWRYSRHPNYFGEAVLWWGLGLIALNSPAGALALAGPALLTFLLLRVSGVRMTEQRMAARPGYADYVRRTSAFVPLPPRRS